MPLNLQKCLIKLQLLLINILLTAFNAEYQLILNFINTMFIMCKVNKIL